MRYRVIAAVGYLAYMAAIVFQVDPPGTYPQALVLAVFLGSQFALGLAIGRWWSLLLPAAIVLVLLPAVGTADSEIPVPFLMMIGAVFTVPLAALGVIVRRVCSYRPASRATREPRSARENALVAALRK
jgi:cytosine/uracil/thiamine/allantoin permease